LERNIPFYGNQHVPPSVKFKRTVTDIGRDAKIANEPMKS